MVVLCFHGYLIFFMNCAVRNMKRTCKGASLGCNWEISVLLCANDIVLDPSKKKKPEY